MPVLSEEGDRQQLLRAELKLIKFSTSTNLVVIDTNKPQSSYISLVSLMSRGKLPAFIKSPAQAR